MVDAIQYRNGKEILTNVDLTDNLDGGKADQTLMLSFEGVTYEIDLSKKNAASLQKEHISCRRV